MSLLSKWLRAREAPGNCAVRTANGSVAMDAVEETDTIYQFGVRFWDNNQKHLPSLEDRCHTIRQGVAATSQKGSFPHLREFSSAGTFNLPMVRLDAMGHGKE